MIFDDDGPAVAAADPLRITGAGSGGGKSGGGASTAPDTLFSTATIRLVDLVGEGEIVGVRGGLKGVYLNDVPVQNTDGSFNFRGLTAEFRVGAPDQIYMSGYADVQTPKDVGVKVNQATPVTVSISDTDVDRLRVTIQIPTLLLAKTDGPVQANTVRYRVQARYSGGPWVNSLGDQSITGKTSSGYFRSHEIALPRNPNGASAPWQVQVIRLSPDTDGFNNSQSKFTNQSDLIFHSTTSIVDAKFSYPSSAVVGLTAQASSFGSSVPGRTYLVDGVLMPIPSNYDPAARTYNGIWDGTFKQGFSNNPAWALYLVLSDNRFGLGEFIDVAAIDKWSLYEIGRYCDQLVDDGKGGREPRYVFNGCIATQEEAFELLQLVAQIFRGVVYWSSGTVTATQDRPADPVLLVTEASAIDGLFSYASSGRKARHTVALVTWNDPDNLYKQAIEVVEDSDGVARYGYNPTQIDLLGCTSRGQAHRAGLWKLFTELRQTQIVSYKAGLDHAIARPGDLVAIQDPQIANLDLSGRLIDGSTATTLKLDRAVTLVSGASYSVSVTLPDGTVEDRPITTAAGTVTTIALRTALSKAPDPAAVWLIAGPIKPQLFRIISIREEQPHVYAVSALQHEPGKYAAIDDGAAFEASPVTEFPNIVLAPTNLAVRESQYTELGQPRQALTLSWTAGQPFNSVAYAVTIVRPSGAVLTSRTASTSLDILDAETGVWNFTVTAIGLNGRPSLPAQTTYTVVGWAGQAATSIANLAVKGGGSTFSGRSCTLAWTNQRAATVPPYPIRNVVYVFDASTQALLHREVLTAGQTEWTYDYQVNVNEGGPRRTFRVGVSAYSPAEVEGPPTYLTVTNPAPAVIAPIADANSESLLVELPKVSDPDFAGYLVWVSETAGINPVTAKSYDVQGNLFVFKGTPEKTYYIRAAAYDAFSKNPAELNVSAEISKRISILLFDPSAPARPARPTLTTAIEISADGTVTSSVTATVPAVTSENLSHYEIAWQIGTGGFAVRKSDGNVATERGFLPGTTINAKARSISKMGFASDYSDLATIVAARNTAPPANPTSPSVSAGFERAVVTWTAPANLDLKWVEIWAANSSSTAAAPIAGSTLIGYAPFGQTQFWDTLPTTGTRTYWLRSVNTSDVTATAYLRAGVGVSAALEATQLKAGIIDATKVAAGLEIPGVVASLPATSGYTGPRTVFNTGDGKLYRLVGGAWTAAVPTTDLTGQIADAQIAALGATKISGQIADAQIGALSTNKLVGQIVAGQVADAAITLAKFGAGLKPIAEVSTLPNPSGYTGPNVLFNTGDGKLYRLISGAWVTSITAGDISGAIQAAQIAGLEASKITGQLSNAQLASIDAAKVAGQLADGQIAGVSAAKISGTIVANQIADAAITLAKFGTGLRPVGEVSALPAVSGYTGPNVVFNTGDGKVYRLVNSAWVTSVTAADISGIIQAAQIAALEAAKITGQLSNAQLAAIDAAKITGSILAAQIDSVPAVKVTGQLTNDQLTAIDAAKISGQLADTQLAGISGAKITGAITAATLATARLTGTILDNQIAAVAAAKLTGQITSTQITDSAVTTAKVAAGAITANEIAANAIVADKILAGSITTSKLLLTDAQSLNGNNDFLQGLDGWYRNSTLVTVSTPTTGDIPAGCPSTNAARMERTTAATVLDTTPVAHGVADAVRWGFPCTVGDQFYAEAWVYQNTASTFLFQLLNRGTADSSAVVATTNKSAATATTGAWVKVTALLTATRNGRAYLRCVTNVNNTVTYVTNVRLMRRQAAELIVDGSIVAAQIQASQISATHIVAGTITATELAANSVTTAKLVAGAVTVDTVAANAITTAKIAANAVTANEIAAGAIVAGKIAADAVTAVAILAGSITTAKIAAGAITANEIAAATITATELAAGSIIAGKIAAGAVTAETIAAGAVVAASIAANQISATHIAAGIITANEIAAGTITAANLAAGIITADKIAVGLNTGNLLANSDVLSGINNFRLTTNQWAGGFVQLRTDFCPPGMNAATAAVTVNPEVGQFSDIGFFPVAADGTYAFHIPVVAGQRYEVQVATNNLRCTSRLFVVFYDTAKAAVTNGTVGAPATMPATHTGVGQPLTSYTQNRMFVTAPTGAAYMRVFVRATYTGTGPAGNGCYCSTFAWFLAKALSNQTEFSPYAPQSATVIDGGYIATNTIVARSIVARTITSTEIAANTIAAVNILARSITATEIRTGTITATEIAANTITASQIAADTITSTQIRAGTIVAANIAAGTITAGNIAAGAIVADKIGANQISATHIVAGTITATELAANSITTGKIAAGAVTATQIASRTILADNLVAGTITTTEIRVGGVNADRLVANSITASQIAANTITATQIATRTITANELAAGSITTSKLAIASFNQIFNSNGAQTTSAGTPLGMVYSTNNTGLGGSIYSRTDNSFPGVLAFLMRLDSPPAANTVTDMAHRMADGSWPRIQPGQVYEISAYVAGYDATQWLYANWLTAAGGTLSAAYRGVVQPTNLGVVRVGGFTNVAPADAVFLAIYYRAGWTGGDNHHLFVSAPMLAPAVPGQTELSPYVDSGVTVIDGTNIRTGSITASQIAANTITAGTIAAGAIGVTQLAANAVVADKIAANAIVAGKVAAEAITAREIRAGTITTDLLQAGGINVDTIAATGSISTNKLAADVLTAANITVGSTRLNTWVSAADTTRINGGSIAANSISAGTLQIAQRGVSISGLDFTYNQSNRQVSWTAGTIGYINNAGTVTSVNITAANTPTLGTGSTFIYWVQGGTALQTTTTLATAAAQTNVHIATYNGTTGLVVYRGSTMIDGMRIIARSITADIIAAGAIQTSHMAANSISGDRIAAGSLSADKISTGTLTVGQNLFIGNDKFQIIPHGNSGQIRFTNNEANAWRLVMGELREFTQNGDFGIMAWDGSNQLQFKVASTGSYLNGAIIGAATIGTAQIGDATIVSAKIGDLEVGNLKIADGAVTNSTSATGAVNAKAVDVSIFIRKANTKIFLIAQRDGDPYQDYLTNTNMGEFGLSAYPPGGGNTSIRKLINAYSTFTPDGKNYYLRPMPTVVSGLYTAPAAGTYTFRVADSTPTNNGYTTITVMELAK